MKKPYKGKLFGWQIHELKLTKSYIALLKKMYPSALSKPPKMITGTIAKSSKDRNGKHTRTSLVVKIDRKKNKIETINSIYSFDPDTEGQDVMPQMGNDVLNIFY